MDLPGLLSPANVRAVTGPEPGEIDLSWENRAQYASFNAILIGTNADQSTWRAVARVPAGATAYAIKRLIPGRAYWVALAAGRDR